MSNRDAIDNASLAEALRPPELEQAVGRAAERLARRADGEGLVDVAYANADTPLGPILVAGTPRGLVRVAFPTEREEDVLFELAESVSPRVLHSPARLDEVRREMEQYFERARERFEVRLDWRLTRGFYRDVLRATARVPYGETLSYAEIAARAGRPRAFRAAGSALGSNPLPLIVPCHRVIASGGGLGGYGGGLDVKEFLLGLEGAR
jgi:methylated-DNA-[protein]-cysteine S-methyltransferase